MSWIDWLIVVVPVVFIIGIAFYTKRYARSAADFLAAGRVAGRYVISVGDLMSWLSVIILIAGCEQTYQTGFGISFWNNILTPISLVLALTGFCTYRWRQTRCLSKGQFIELRYGSKFFRIFTAFISTFSEMITNALGPAIAANFFLYYLGLPHKIMICGINLPCYVIIVATCLVLAMLILWPAGRISLLITDSLQAVLSYPIFVMIVGFIILKLSWDVDVTPLLWDRVPQESFINPYDVAQFRDFNIFALVTQVTSSIMNRASWIGNDASNAGRTPHEQKMAGILGAWRGGLGLMMIGILALLTYVFMNSGNFAALDKNNHFKVTNNEVRQELSSRVLDEAVADPARRDAAKNALAALPDIRHEIGKDAPISQSKNLDTRYFDTVRQSLGDSPEALAEFQQYRSLYNQMQMPVVTSKLFPVGLIGFFCLLMVMLLISTDDARLFNASCCITQDMILPLFKKRITPEKHITLIRFTTLGVAIFFLLAAMFMTQMDYINMLMTILTAIWLGGSGPIMVFGLYTRFGNLAGAWASLILGSGTSGLGLIFQRNWAKTIYPWLDANGWVESLDSFLVAVSAPFDPWIRWSMDPVKFPINSYEILFISIMLSIIGYVAFSFIFYKPFNLDKLLHRGEYSDGEDEVPAGKTKFSIKTLILDKMVGITPEYSRGDRIIAWSVFALFLYNFVLAFLVPLIWNLFQSWPKSWWNTYFWVTFLAVPVATGLISTVWFMIGGTHDTIRLFRDLARRVENPDDNGQVLAEDAEQQK